MTGLKASDFTDWYPKNIKPKRKGYYQRKYSNIFWRHRPDYWDGRHWYICFADGSTVRLGTNEFWLPWRGLLKQAPKKFQEK